MGEQKSIGILLKQTPLANDDVILDFFTKDFGRVSLFARKFSRSKKRSEIDFFRLIELGWFQGRNSKSLRQARTREFFPAFGVTLNSNRSGFQIIKTLEKHLPAEKSAEKLLRTMLEIFSHFEDNPAATHLAYAWIKILDASGVLPHFDRIRGDFFFDPWHQQCTNNKTPNSLFMDNQTRQLWEFLRRHDPSVFFEKFSRLPHEKSAEILSFLEKIDQ